MSWLTGNQIQKEVENGKIFIDPFRSDQINPNSYDYRLAPIVRKLKNNSVIFGKPVVDPKLPMKYEDAYITKEGYLLLENEAYLCHTEEKFGSDYFASLVTGKSSVGRLFLQNHACAGLIDIGFHGHITLEITVKIPVVIYPYMRIGQIFWFQSFGEISLYGGKYQKENSAMPSLIYKDI